MRWNVVVVLVAVAVGSLGFGLPEATAQFVPSFSPMEGAILYGQDSVGRLDTGITNIGFGWTEVLIYPAKGAVSRDSSFPVSNLLYHIPVGVCTGATAAVRKTARGLFQTATFLIPKNDYWDRY